MKKLSLPRQLLLLVLLSTGLTIVASGSSYLMLRQSIKSSSTVTHKVMADLDRNFALLSGLAQNQSLLQTVLRQKDPDEIERVVNLLSTNRSTVATLFKNAGSSAGSLPQIFTQLGAAEQLVLQDFLLGKAGQAYEQFLSSYGPQYEVLLKAVQEQNLALKRETTATLSRTEDSLESQSRWLIIGVGLTIVLLMTIAWGMKNGIAATLQRITRDLASCSDTVSRGMTQVSSGSQSLAEAANEQAASLEETSSTLEEISSMTQRNADNATKAKDMAGQARAAADTSAAELEAMNKAMIEIQTSSQEISKIIKTIDEVAFQTNILALNAAVEAARAGEAGMGFAVVADEVRNLAQRCALSARETADKIDSAMSKTHTGVEISSRVSQALTDILGKVRQLDEYVGEVASASKEQSQGIGQVNTAVAQMDGITQSTAANAEEGASVAEELSREAESLKKAVRDLQGLLGTNAEAVAKPSEASRPQKKHKNSVIEMPEKSRARVTREPALSLVGADRQDKSIHYS